MLVDCKECEKRVAGLVIGCYEYHDAASGPPTRVTLLRCPRCQHPIVVKEEERWFDSWSKPETIYPCEGKLLNPDLPDSVRSTMVEARSSAEVVFIPQAL
jgi:NMD protein affecting ribosome stability and mRNA decay